MPMEREREQKEVKGPQDRRGIKVRKRVEWVKRMQIPKWTDSDENTMIKEQNDQREHTEH